MCLNWKVLAALVVVAAGIYVAAPAAFFTASPLLFLAACPLSMILMMKMMNGGGRTACGSTSCPQPSGARPAQPMGRDQVEAELERLQARRSALAAQLEAVRASRDQQV